MDSGAQAHATMSTMLLLDTVLKQARELRGDVSAAELQPVDVKHFERALSRIERRALKLFSMLV